MKREEIIQNIKDCGQSIIDNAENIAGDFKYGCYGRTLTCHFNDPGEPPYIEIYTAFMPENWIERF